MEKITAALAIGTLAGTLLGYSLAPKSSEASMQSLEQQIETTQQELTRQQGIARDALNKLNAIEEQNKQIDLKMKGSLDDLQRTNTEIQNVFERLKAQVKILRKALCNYSNDFCAPAAHGGTGPG